jgi:hypothetical protein
MDVLVNLLVSQIGVHTRTVRPAALIGFLTTEIAVGNVAPELLSLAPRAIPMDIASTTGPRKLVITVMTLFSVRNRDLL